MYEDYLEWFFEQCISTEWAYKEERKLFLDDDGALPDYKELSASHVKELRVLYLDYLDAEKYQDSLQGEPR